MKNKAFTLIELLVVISIIGVLSSIVLVSFSDSRDKARLAKAQQFDAQVSHALGAYAVGIWRFEEGSGTTLLDESGFGNDGTFSGNPTPVFPAGVYSGTTALEFDGTDDYVDCGNLGISIETWTQELWLKTTVAGKMPMTIGDASIYLNHGIAWSGNVWYPGFTSVTDGNWHHLVITYDNPSDIVRIYVDGKLDVEGSKSWGNVNGPIFIGAGTWGSPPDYEFNGSIDDVRIYNEALSSAQIQQHYVAGAALHGIAIK